MVEFKQKEGFRRDIGDLTVNNINQYKKLHSVLFPIRYSEQFYKDALDSDDLTLFNDIPVGCFCSVRKENEVYLMTFGVLAPYRKLGLGTLMLEHLKETCKKLKITSIFLHVHVDNVVAKEFYVKRGFNVKETIPDYYKNMKENSAWLLELNL